MPKDTRKADAPAPSLAQIQARIRGLANPKLADALQGFFKTGPGGYGEGDRFLGIRVPVTRGVAREFRSASLATVKRLLASQWHEERLLALEILIMQFERGDESARRAIYDLYLASTDRIDNWDLVDGSAPKIVGGWLRERSRRPLHALAKSNSLWERRIAVVATLHFVARRDFDDAIAICETLLGDKHDLMHKACGWVLREVGKRDRATLVAFLRKHAHTMPRTSLRYSLEHFEPEDRKPFMEARRLAGL